MKNTRGNTLFLHGGPGMSTGVERLWFGEDLPIRWWDQPIEALWAPAPLDALTDAATAEVARMADACGEPVHVVAHCFGGQIAHALARRCPERLHRITLLGCAHNVLGGLFRLAGRTAESGGSRILADAIATARQHLDGDSFEAMMLAVAADPLFPGIYFGPGSAAARNRFLDLVPQTNFIDVAAYLAGMKKMLALPPPVPLPDFAGEAALVVGRHAPVLAIEEDIAAWRAVFPHLRAMAVEAGHFVHLETPPTVWLEA